MPTLRSILSLPTISSLIYLALPTLPPASAYIPAVPINDTFALNLTDNSQIGISWTDPISVYGGRVSYQLRADVPTGGRTSGALVHFTEGKMGPNLTTSTPWIAYISCDVNETGASMEWDIFTLARDRGAVSALLYTATSQSCLLNQEYITDFEKPLDVFATKTVQVARVIDNQWTHTNDTFYYYNGTLLNESVVDVNNSVAGNPPAYRTYLIGTLTARNSTGQATHTDIPNSATSSAASSGKKGTPGSMIALYVITALISTAFVLMIIVGARRALRHPERYGRREADDEQGPQSTAGGLAQAILDTFPIIKFHRNAEDAEAKRISSERGTIDMQALPALQRSLSLQHSREGFTDEKASLQRRTTSASMDGFSAKVSSSPSTSRRTSALDLHRNMEIPSTSTSGAFAAANGEVIADGERPDDQCPICLLEFETGDDLRVLPCEIGHVYHQTCIDPWLLEVSSSCPLCRKDFNPANEPITPTQPTSSETQTQPPTQSGFPRYLAFMRRERRSGAGAAGRSRANTLTDTEQIGRGRRREADQTGPGGY